MLKETYAEPTTPSAAQVLALGLEYGFFEKLSEIETGLAVEATRDAYTLSLDFDNRTTIDFCDMVWAPVVLGLAPKSRYQVVMVDELQDISRPQLAMLRMVMIPTGRFIGVGDLKQQIYQWRGSMGGAAWSIVKEDLQAKTFPLTMTWRCATKIVETARALVPNLRARVGAPEGHVQDCTWENLPRSITGGHQAEHGTGIHTFVLSRNNANLIDCALYLWRERVRFELNAGKELLDPLFTLLDTKLDLRDPTRFNKSLAEWERVELARAEKANATAYADRVEEQAAMLRVAASYAPPARIKHLLSDILAPNDSGVLLSTVHKVKGLEAERVFLLKQTFARHDERACKFCEGSGNACRACNGSGRWTKPPEPEELNIEYVGITRAISRLVWVDIRGRDGGRRRQVEQVLSSIGPDEGELSALMRATLGIKTEAEQLKEADARFLGLKDKL
jgi:superfamily I DNA/RNA helicase